MDNPGIIYQDQDLAVFTHIGGSAYTHLILETRILTYTLVFLKLVIFYAHAITFR